MQTPAGNGLVRVGYAETIRSDLPKQMVRRDAPRASSRAGLSVGQCVGPRSYIVVRCGARLPFSFSIVYCFDADWG